uniref:hypothetical protein n=1 Tax=Nocardia carnea TaxID=37328 RepID=UPI002457C70D
GRCASTYAGARPLAEFGARAVLGVLSAAGFAVVRPLPGGWCAGGHADRPVHPGVRAGTMSSVGGCRP